MKGSRSKTSSLGAKRCRVVVLYTEAGPAFLNAPTKVREAEDLSGNAIKIEQTLQDLGYDSTKLAFGEDVSHLIDRLRDIQPNAVFNLAEAPLGCYEKEPHAPALLELLGLPYTGNGPGILAFCKDKALAKERLRAAGLPTPASCVFSSIPLRAPALKFPLVVKPLRQDGSLGITEHSVVENYAALKRAVEDVLHHLNQAALVEEFLCGREFNVSVLGNGTQEAPYRVFPPGEYVYHSKQWRVCTFEAKWDENHPSYAAVEGVYPSRLTARLKRQLEETTLASARLFELSGYARIDLRLDADGVPHVLEINPNPDLAPRMGIARSAETAGLKYSEFIQEILRLGMLKGRR